MSATSWLLLAAAARAAEPGLILSVEGREGPAREPLRAVSAATRLALEEAPAAHAGDALEPLPGVEVQETSPGRASPILRGLIGGSNLFLVGPARLNHGAARPVLSVATVDPESLDRVEVLRGPGSVLFGADALGGVVRFLPRRPPESGQGRLAAFYRTADRAAMLRAEAGGRLGGLGLLGGATFRSFGDRRLGGGLGEASPAGYDARAWDLSAERAAGDWRWRALWQHARLDDAPRYDQLLGSRRFGGPGDFEEFLTDPERRDLLLLEGSGPAGGSRLSAALWGHRQEEATFQRRVGSTVRQERENVVRTAGARLEALSEPGGIELVWGADGFLDRVASSRTDLDLGTGSRAAVPDGSDFPDGSRFGSAGAFALLRGRPAGRWTLEAGARLAASWVDTVLRAPPAAGARFRDRYDSLTGGAGVSCEAGGGWLLRLSLWQGFRPPNLNETAALKTTASGADVPSAGLEPEKALGAEVSARRVGSRGRQEWTFSASRLSRLIERVPALFGGLPFLDLDGDLAQDPGEPPVFRRANTGRGTVLAAEWEGERLLGPALRLLGSAHWTRGRNDSTGEPLSRIPPLGGRGALRWEPLLARSPWLELGARADARQSRLSPGDLADPRIDPSGSRGWTVLELKAGLRPSPGLTVTAGLENLLDEGYREHGSGVDGPGRGAWLRLDRRF